jgi:acyl carrier protein
MTNIEIREKLIDILQEINPDEVMSNIKDDDNLRDVCGFDSMDFLDVVMEVRKQFKVEVPAEDYENLRTLGKSVAYLAVKLETSKISA